jgi:methionyl-tRNA formyltransferase
LPTLQKLWKQKEIRNKMKIVFFGTPDFAVGTLKALIENKKEVIAVVTAPDKPAGRGRQLSESAVKTFAVKQHLNILQPEKLKSEEFIHTLKNLNADLFIVVAFRMLPEIVWKMPARGTFNLHASLLPQYRGAAPINWALINGEHTTGVTTFFLKHEIDTGNIIDQKEVKILPEDNLGSLYEKLMNIGAELVVKTVNDLEAGEVKTFEQTKLAEGKTLYHAPKIFKELGKINWQKDAISIHNLIRGLSPYPTAYTELIGEPDKNLQIKIFNAETLQTDVLNASPGKVYSDGKNYLHIDTSKGKISILDLQLSGKKRMSIQEFLRGTPLLVDYKAF